jgi:hypothetical protein
LIPWEGNVHLIGRGVHHPCRTARGSGRGVTFVEVILAFVIMGVVLLPVFAFLTQSVKETERFYCEAVAISQAKFIMDTLLFQVPWRTIREGPAGARNVCRFQDPKNIGAINSLLGQLMPKMFGTGYQTGTPNVYRGDGLITDRKGFLYRVRLKCIDIHTMQFAMDLPGRGRVTFPTEKLTPKDADGNYTVMKKLILEVRWSIDKGKDPLNDPNAKVLHLVAIKSDLEA